MTVNVNEQVPDFTLQASNGEQITLSDFRGSKVIIYFYPKDMTPGCTTQACDFRDFHPQFSDLKTVILGISTDPLSKHEKFVDKYGLPFLLLVDEDHKVADQFGVWVQKKTFGKEYMGIERSTFLIDEQGKLVNEWRKVKVKGHVEEALNYLKEQPL